MRTFKKRTKRARFSIVFTMIILFMLSICINAFSAFAKNDNNTEESVVELKVKNTSIIVHINSRKECVKSIYIIYNGTRIDLIENGGVYKVSDQGELVSTNITKIVVVKIDDSEQIFEPASNYTMGVEAGGTINYGKEKGTEIDVDPPVNNAPTIEDDIEITLVNTSKSKASTWNEPDGDEVVFTVDTDPVHGVASINSSGTWTYTPTADYTGTDNFVIRVTDEYGLSDTATITMTINVALKENLVPTVGNYEQTIYKNNSATGTVIGSDADEDSLAYSKGSGSSYGSVMVNSDGTWTYTPAENYVGDDSFTVIVSDGHEGGTASSIITIHVVNYIEDKNNSPTVPDYNYTIYKNNDLEKTVVGIDPDGDTLVYSKNSDPEYGTITLGCDGKFIYVPKHNYVGTDSFTVIVSDGKGGTAISTVNIKIRARSTSHSHNDGNVNEIPAQPTTPKQTETHALPAPEEETQEEIPGAPAALLEEEPDVKAETIPAGLPKTGGTPAYLFYGLGVIFAGAGVFIRKFTK